MVEKSFRLNSGKWILPICCVLSLVTPERGTAQSPLPGAVGQQAVTDAAAQQERDRQARQAMQLRPEEAEQVEAVELSPDLGSLQLMRERPQLPFFRLRADQSYSWLSNANYAKSSPNVIAAWQTISSLEAAWAPTFSTMPGYDQFFPEAGVRASFFNYFEQESAPSGYPKDPNYDGIYDIGVVQDFVLVNLFLRANRQVTDELSVGLSLDYNGYFYLNSTDDRAAQTGASLAETEPTNFLNEYVLAYTSNFFHSFSEKHAVALSWRASYVFANSPGTPEGFNANFLTRTDNSLNGSLFLTLSDRISLSPFASYRIAYYTDASNAQLLPNYSSDGTTVVSSENGFYRRLDQQYTLGIGMNFQLSPELSTALSVNYSQSNSTSKIAETGDFTNLTAGANWSMTYKFSEKEFQVAQRSDGVGPYIRTDLGFAFPQSMESSSTLTGSVLPGVTGTLANPSLTMNPGLRFDVAPGYNFNDWLGAEFSAGVLYNGLDQLRGTGSLTTVGGSETLGPGGVAITGRYVQVPALVSAVFRWPGQGRWKPYVSTGIGAAYSQLYVHQIADTITSDDMSEQFSPAFSVGAGFLWQVADTVDFDLMYKLLGVINPDYSSFEPGVVLSNSFQFGINIRF